MATKITAGAALTGTLQTIYTVPDYKEADWVLMYITNTSGSNGTVTVNYYNAETSTTLPVLDGYTISAKDFFNIGGKFNEFIYLKSGDYIQASSTQTMTLLVSVIENNSNR